MLTKFVNAVAQGTDTRIVQKVSYNRVQRWYDYSDGKAHAHVGITQCSFSLVTALVIAQC